MSSSLENGRNGDAGDEVAVRLLSEDLETVDFVQPTKGAAGGILNFELYIDDDRYSVPTLHLIAALDEAMALEMARIRLEESDHHVGVELWRDGRRLVVLGAPRRHAKTA